MATPARLIDVSHTVEHGMITYKGLPAPVICDFLSREASRAKYAPGTEFQIGKIDRFDQVIVTPGLARLFPVAFLSPSGEGNDHHLLAPRTSPDLTSRVEAIQSR